MMQKKPSEQLERVMADLHVDCAGDANADDDDLLALMDSAASH